MIEPASPTLKAAIEHICLAYSNIEARKDREIKSLQESRDLLIENHKSEVNVLQAVCEGKDLEIKGLTASRDLTIRNSRTLGDRLESQMTRMAAQITKLKCLYKESELRLKDGGVMATEIDSMTLTAKEMIIESLVKENARLFLKIGEERLNNKRKNDVLWSDPTIKSIVSDTKEDDVSDDESLTVDDLTEEDLTEDEVINDSLTAPMPVDLESDLPIIISHIPLSIVDQNSFEDRVVHDSIPTKSRIFKIVKTTSKSESTDLNYTSPSKKRYSAAKRKITVKAVKSRYIKQAEGEATPTISHPYNEVIRDKNTRAQLHGFDCPCCAGYFKLTEDLEPLRELGMKKVSNKEIVSRHRAWYKRPETPPGFWNMDFSQ